VALFETALLNKGFGVNGNIGWAALLAAAYTRRADVLNQVFGLQHESRPRTATARLWALEQVSSLASTSSSTDESDSSSGMLFCTVLEPTMRPGEGQHAVETLENLVELSRVFVLAVKTVAAVAFHYSVHSAAVHGRCGPL
jgi:hypothetical protein